MLQNLSKRLIAVSDLVSEGSYVVDVGTDHAYVPIFLVESGKIKRALAMDVNKGPLLRAQEHICEHHLEDVIQTRLSDGLSALKEGEGDTLIVAGMGGNLTIRILSEGEGLLTSFSEMILQPQSELERVREYIRKHGYHIACEDMIKEDGKYYPMMRVVPGKDQRSQEPLFDLYGPCLLTNANPVLKEFLEKQIHGFEKIIKHLQSVSDEKNEEKREERIKVVSNEMHMAKTALERYFK